MNHRPGILEPALTDTTGIETRIPNTDQIDGDTHLNVVGWISTHNTSGQPSLLGHTITEVNSPNEDMEHALEELAEAANGTCPRGTR